MKLNPAAGKLRVWMGANGYSQERLAKALKLHQSSISGWLRGPSRPEPHHRKAIERLTGVPEVDWMTDEERVFVQGIEAASPAAA